MKTEMAARARALAEYVIETGGTVRSAARRFGISKSTVYTDLTERLRQWDLPLWRAVRAVLEKNKAERHLRGGEATRRKYEAVRK
jgi:putative DeoR family transcriptional regulator (stage III sporulation protein D)